LDDVVNRMNQDAGGLFMLAVCPPRLRERMTGAAEAGDPDALLILGEIAEVAQGRTVRCLHCGAHVDDPLSAAIVVLRAAAKQPSAAISGSLCVSCADGSDPEVMERAMTATRKAVPNWRGLDPLYVDFEGGRA
jgi:hypothetical protein